MTMRRGGGGGIQWEDGRKKEKVLMICDCHPRICGIRLDRCPGDLSSDNPGESSLMQDKGQKKIGYDNSPSIYPDFLIVILGI
jgi:hypothetical protein